MLASVLPMSQIAVTSQLDPAKSAPVLPPVAPAQPVAADKEVQLGARDPEESASRLREEQRRQQRRDKRRAPREQMTTEQHLPVPGHQLNADNTVPVAPLIEGEARQGLWVDIQI